MTAHYLDLTGADIIIRLEEQRPAEIFGLASPMAFINDTPCEVDSIGLTSATIRFLPPGADNGPVRFELRQAGKQILETSARIVRNADDDEIYLEYEETLDLQELKARNALALAQNIGTVASHNRHEIPTDWKILCADLLGQIGTARDYIENYLEPFHGDMSPEDITSVTTALERAAEPEWADFHRRGHLLYNEFRDDPELLRITKLYTERTVTRELVHGESWHRSYYKPLGYPGDYKIMDYFYRNEALGDTIYQKYLHILGLIAGRGIVSRMKQISGHLVSLADRFPDSDTVRATSFGAGPAREVKEFLLGTPELQKTYEFRLIDQEKNALNYAISEAYQARKIPSPNLSVIGLNTTFTQMLRPSSLLSDVPPQHLIYSAGLLDYIEDNLSKRFVRKLYDLVEPGGQIVIGNIADCDTAGYWILEHILDWSMIIRDRARMESMAEKCEGAEISVELDPTGTIYMLIITKPW